jgi:hypothetical protein
MVSGELVLPALAALVESAAADPTAADVGIG